MNREFRIRNQSEVKLGAGGDLWIDGEEVFLRAYRDPFKTPPHQALRPVRRTTGLNGELIKVFLVGLSSFDLIVRHIKPKVGRDYWDIDRLGMKVAMGEAFESITVAT